MPFLILKLIFCIVSYYCTGIVLRYRAYRLYALFRREILVLRKNFWFTTSHLFRDSFSWFIAVAHLIEANIKTAVVK